MENINKFDYYFSYIIFEQIKAYNSADDLYLKKKLKENLIDTLKKWTDQPVKMVSEQVFMKAKELEVNPYILQWKDRKRLGNSLTIKGKPSSWLVWEHTTPLSQFFKDLIKCKNRNDVLSELRNYSGVCWISRDEDNRLNSNGFKSVRPKGWKCCYDLVDIKIHKS